MKKHVRAILGVLGALATLGAAAGVAAGKMRAADGGDMVSYLQMMRSDHAEKELARQRAAARGEPVIYRTKFGSDQ
jgi:hypothetical protein